MGCDMATGFFSTVCLAAALKLQPGGGHAAAQCTKFLMPNQQSSETQKNVLIVRPASSRDLVRPQANAASQAPKSRWLSCSRRLIENAAF